MTHDSGAEGDGDGDGDVEAGAVAAVLGVVPALAGELADGAERNLLPGILRKPHPSERLEIMDRHVSHNGVEFSHSRYSRCRARIVALQRRRLCDMAYGGQS